MQFIMKIHPCSTAHFMPETQKNVDSHEAVHAYNQFESGLPLENLLEIVN